MHALTPTAILPDVICSTKERDYIYDAPVQNGCSENAVRQMHCSALMRRLVRNYVSHATVIFSVIVEALGVAVLKSYSRFAKYRVSCATSAERLLCIASHWNL